MKNKIQFLIIVIILCLTQNSFSQDIQVIIDAKKDIVFKSYELTYYGIDFSNLKLINPRKMDQGKLIKYTYCPAWIEKFDDHFPNKRVTRMLSVPTVHDKRQTFQKEQFMKANETSIVTYRPSMLNGDSISTIVKDYNLQQQEGIGVSIIVSDFAKHNEIATGYVTFFDINTRELLYVVKIDRKARGRGMTSHWFEGMYGIWAYFIKYNYRIEKKPYLVK